MNFFPNVEPLPDRGDCDEPVIPVWAGAPEDVMPGVVPVELVLGRSESTVVLLTSIRAFPTGLSMHLSVRVRGPLGHRDLHAETFDGPFSHNADTDWQARRLKWGFEFADGTRATNVDPFLPLPDHDDPTWEPDRPVLMGGGGGGSPRSIDRDYWLWPLPPAGTLRVACEWLDHGIEMTVQDVPLAPILDAATRSAPLWP